MRSFRFAAPVLLLASLTLAGTGCVSQGELDNSRKTNRTYEERIFDLERQLTHAKKSLAEMQARRDENAAQLAKFKATNEELTKQLGDLKAQYAELSKTSGNIVINQALPTNLNTALANLAAANPDLMTYDAASGMIRLKSDLTFALGSTDVNEKAVEALKKLAEVLNRDDAARYEVQVVGHTDNVPVTSATNKTRFEDNWGLSAARAQAVIQTLSEGGVQEGRMALVGYGEQKPVAENGSNGEGKKTGSAANRRVEIYLREARIAKTEIAVKEAPKAQPQKVEEAPTGTVTEKTQGDKFENLK